VGVHTAVFAGLPASGADVRVPYSVIYDLRDDRIAALRIYMPMDVLIGQIQGARAGATPATA
jgi:predicted ester cyclase